MARTQHTAFRVDSDVIDAVRERHGLTDAPLSVVIRHALALAGGLDPVRVARLPLGPRPRTREATA